MMVGGILVSVYASSGISYLTLEHIANISQHYECCIGAKANIDY